MISDAVESASRTLSEPTPARIEGLVRELLEKRLDDGQFDECGLTLREIGEIRESLIKSLIGIYHGRVKYPRAADGMSPEPPRSTTALDAPRIAVEVSDLQAHVRIDPAAVADLARRVLEGEGVHAASISLALVDDAAIHGLNRRHLGHDWPTDVITFGLSDPDEPVLAGELIVSAEMAATTARAAGIDPLTELRLYIVHGLLHLCGYDDRSATASESMRRREGEVLAALGLVNPFPMVGAAHAGGGMTR